MRQTHIALAALLTLAGCETAPPAPQMRWWHLHPSQERARTDGWECMRDAGMAAPPSQRITTTGGFRVGTTWIPQNIRSDDENAARRAALEQMCMEARGWRMAPTDPFAAQRPAPRPAQPSAAAAQRPSPIVLAPDQELRLREAADAMMRAPDATASWASPPPAR